MRGICLKEPMFNATVAGIKTQTRRLSNLALVNENPDKWKNFVLCNDQRFGFTRQTDGFIEVIMPYYHLDEILYLKEPYFIWEPEHCASRAERIQYKFGADKQVEEFRKEEHQLGYETYYWHNKLFMKADYARYHIKIKEITCTRINDISKFDAISEGFKSIAAFHNYWISMYGWSSLKLNPYVFTYHFQLTNINKK
jgi:hypothetical protein